MQAVDIRSSALTTRLHGPIRHRIQNREPIQRHRAEVQVRLLRRGRTRRPAILPHPAIPLVAAARTAVAVLTVEETAAATAVVRHTGVADRAIRDLSS